MASCQLQFVLPVFCVIGFLARLLLLRNNAASKLLINRVEISTPVSSWKRVIEGLSLMEKGIDPYEGDIFHETPLSLEFYKRIKNLDDNTVPLVFAICEVLTALVLSLSAAFYLKNLTRRESIKENFAESAHIILTRYEQSQQIPYYVALIYLFCPFAIATCCGKSTMVFLNLLVALFLLFVTGGRWIEASIVLSILSYQSFYHVTLIVPLVMFYLHSCDFDLNLLSLCKTVFIVLTFITTLCGLLYVSYLKPGSWDFVVSTYGFMLSVPDLTPNIGLFWYFFTEMFEHFRVFFLYTFQLNVFIYSVPLAIRLQKEPMMLLFIHLMIIALFKSYPTVGDVAFYLSLLPFWSHLFIYMRQSFIVGCGFVACTLVAPAMWHLWIYSGSANANFFFAVTLAFNTIQIFLLTDVLSAFAKREFYLTKGIPVEPDGKLTLLRLD